jgi:hypothetical protein
MALAFGGGVRPELGRTDYGAVARGSEIAAQLSAQGSQMMGRGLAAGMQDATKAFQEVKAMQGEVKAATALGKALMAEVERGVLPKEMGGMIGSSMEKLNSPDMPLRAQGALARQLQAQFGQIMEAGLQTIMKQQQQAQTADALSRFLSGDEKAAAQIPSDVLNAVTNAQRQVAEREARKQEALDLDAISVIASQSPNLQEAMDIAITQGVKDIRPLVSIYKDLEKMKEKVGGDLPVTVRTVELPNGQTISFAAVWTGTQHQILRPQEQAGDPAEVRARNDLAKRLEKAEAEYSKGNRKEALRELRTAGVTMFRGEPMVDRDLDVYFAPPEGVEAQPKGPPLAPGWTIRK